MNQSEKRNPHTGSLLPFPQEKQAAEAKDRQQAQLILEKTIRALMKNLENEPDPDAQKALQARLWRMVTTGKTE